MRTTDGAKATADKCAALFRPIMKLFPTPVEIAKMDSTLTAAQFASAVASMDLVGSVDPECASFSYRCLVCFGSGCVDHKRVIERGTVWRDEFADIDVRLPSFLPDHIRVVRTWACWGPRAYC